MAFVRVGTALLVVSLIAGCVQQPRRPELTRSPQVEPFRPIAFADDPKRSKSHNFQMRLDQHVWSCELIANSGYRMLKMVGISAAEAYSNNLNACISYARRDSDAAIDYLSSAKRSNSVIDAEKVLYARWKTFIDSLSAFSPVDQSLKNKYSEAKNALIAEMKMQN